MACVHLYAGILFFWPRLHLSSPKLRSRDLRQKGLRGPHLGPWSLWAGQLLLDQKIPGVLSRGTPAASISPPALYTPSFRAGIGMPCLLDCSVEVRWNDAPTELGMDTYAFYCQPDVMFSIYVGQNKTKQKNKDGSPSCFLSTCEASSRTALGAPPD